MSTTLLKKLRKHEALWAAGFLDVLGKLQFEASAAGAFGGRSPWGGPRCASPSDLASWRMA